MTLRRIGLVALGFAAWAAPAAADTVSPAASATVVTIYHDDELSTSDLVRPQSPSEIMDSGLALITETREIDLPAGPSTIRFRGVASTMVPQSADIDGLPAGTIERNFDYDLLSPGSLLAKSVGETVHVVRTDPKTGARSTVAAIIRTGPDGVMLEIGGKLEALRCSGLPEKLVLDKAPDGLTDVPTLAVRTDAPAAGHYTVRLSYIATGLNWSADYVAHVRPGGHGLDLAGWLTLANFGSTGFGRVPVQAVAGRLNATGDDKPIHATAVRLATACWPTNFNWWTPRMSLLPPPPPPPPPPPSPAAFDTRVETVVVTGSRVPEPRALGDYKLYALPEPTDMPARETKQVQFLDLRDVPFERVYRYAVDTDDATGTDPATLLLRLHNTADGGLGKALPAGAFAVSEAGPDGAPVFIGQAGIKDTPVGLPLEIELGDAFSVQVMHEVVENKRIGSGDAVRTQRVVEIEVANRRPEPVTVELRQDLQGSDVRVLSESQPHALDRGAAVWRLTLKPGERAPLRLGLEFPY